MTAPGVAVAPPISAEVAAIPEPIRLDTARGRWIIAATVLGSGMVFLDMTVLNVAIPRIQTDLGASLSDVQWVLDAYLVLLAALLLVGGALGDVYGRKPVFIAGLLIFTLASTGCGFAPNARFLIAFRAIQGIGGALLVPGSLAMIKAVIAAEDSSRAIGLWTGLSSGVASAIGPFVGGYLIGAVSWRTIFFINVPLAALTIWITSRHVPPNRDPEASRDLDWLGALATIVGFGGITFGLIEGPGLGWSSWAVIGSLLIGTLCLLLFLVRESMARNPMVPLGLFRSRNFGVTNAATLAVYFCFYGALLFVTIDLQQVQGYSPLAAGAAFVPISVLLLFLSPRVGALMSRFGARLPMSLGAAIIAVAFVLFALTGRNTPYLTAYLPIIIVLGVGMSIFITPLTSTVLSSVPEHLVGIASGVNNAISRVAALLAIAILGIVVAAGFNSALGPKLVDAHVPAKARSALMSHRDRVMADPIPKSMDVSERRRAKIALEESFLQGFRWTMGISAALCIFSAIICGLMIRDEKRPNAET